MICYEHVTFFPQLFHIFLILRIFGFYQANLLFGVGIVPKFLLEITVLSLETLCFLPNIRNILRKASEYNYTMS